MEYIIIASIGLILGFVAGFIFCLFTDTIKDTTTEYHKEIEFLVHENAKLINKIGQLQQKLNDKEV